MSVSILVVDDEPDVADLFRQQFRREVRQGHYAMHFAHSAEAALDLLCEGVVPELLVILSDINMPGMDGLTGLALLRSEHPTVPIIVVSAARDAAVARRTFDLGASAYVDKKASLEEIAGTVRAVLDGELIAPPDATADSFAQRAAQLTPQQWRVLALMVQGDQNKQIAYKLGVGEPTVKAHVTVILRKLGVRSRTQAVIEARGLALPPA